MTAARDLSNNRLLTSETAKTATGTSVDFTGIPSWVKRITVMFNGVSTSGTSNIQLQLGDSGGFETTGYLSFINTFDATPTGTTITTGFGISENVAAAGLINGQMIITNISSNSWVYSIVTGATGTTVTTLGGGNKTLSDTLDRVRITTVNGTDTFDAGTINILYE